MFNSLPEVLQELPWYIKIGLLVGAVVVVSGISEWWDWFKAEFFDPPYPAPLFSPITPLTPPFLGTKFPLLERPLPALATTMFSSIRDLEFIKKREEVAAHLTYLQAAKLQIDSYYSECTTRFAESRALVRKQQRALRVSIKHAKKVTEGLTPNEALRRHIHSPKPIKTPPAPRYESAAMFQTKFKAINAVAIGGIAAATGTGRIDARGALVAAAGLTAINIVSFQRAVRRMAEADGEMKQYLARARDIVHQLARTHVELVHTSTELADRDGSIRAMIKEVDSPSVIQRYKDGTAAPQEAQTINELIAHAMMSNLYVVKAD